MNVDVAGGDQIVLLLQVQELLEQLNDVERALEHEALDAALRDRVAVRFARLVAARRDELRALRDGIEAGMAAVDAWDELLAIRAATEPLSAECLALLEGGLVRATGLDRGLCRIADEMLGQLARLSECPWGRFTILDQGEYFNSLAEVIRLRFPDLTIWGMPIAAHEFGHFVARQLSARPDWGAPYAVMAGQGIAPGHIDEHFADCYATYALGPAFVCPSVLQRFNPRAAGRATRTHPPPAHRVWLCLHILREMDRGGGLLSPYRDVIELLERTWDGLVRDAGGGDARPSAAEQERLSKAGEVLWNLLELAVGEARYERGSWMHAKAEAAPLLETIANGRTPAAEPAELRDILNTAWMARLAGPPDAAMAIGQWGLRSCVARVPDEAAVEGEDGG
jgi:hypothetical protein